MRLSVYYLSPTFQRPQLWVCWLIVLVVASLGSTISFFWESSEYGDMNMVLTYGGFSCIHFFYTSAYTCKFAECVHAEDNQNINEDPVSSSTFLEYQPLNNVHPDTDW